jgi:ADP-ribose pyrophosphatase YjhB (NUDIX family)
MGSVDGPHGPVQHPHLMGIPNIIRPCAFVFLRAGDRVLVSEMVDAGEGTFYRPPGGGIEFQEHSRDAACRELREEFDLDVPSEELRFLGVIENSFDFRGAPHHELCFVYEALVDGTVLDRLDGVPVPDINPGDHEVAKVFELSELLSLDPVYPEGVQRLLSVDR